MPHGKEFISMGALSCASENSNPWGTIIFMVIIIGMFVLMMFFNRRSQKKRQEESQSILEALKPGNKVKTIGGICGIVVEVCRDDNTFVLETGTEKSGKSYLKFDMQAIYQTDAVAQKPVEEVKKEEEKETVVEEAAPVEEVAPVEAAEEEIAAPVEEAKAEEAAPASKKTTRKKKADK